MATTQIVISGDATQLRRDFEAMAKSAAAIGKSLTEALSAGVKPLATIQGAMARITKAADELKQGRENAKAEFLEIGTALGLAGKELNNFAEKQTKSFEGEATQSLLAALQEIHKQTGQNTEAMRAYAESLGVPAGIAARFTAKSGLEEWLEARTQNLAQGSDKALANFYDTELQESLGKASDAFADMFTGMIRGTKSSSQAFSDFGKSIRDIAGDIMADLARVGMRFVLFGSAEKGKWGSGLLGGLANWFGSWLGGLLNAHGNAFASAGLSAYANSIVASPTVFPFAKGGPFRIGLMGEAGPEAIMPLTRTRTGDLGVRVDLGGNRRGEGMNFYNTNYISVEYTATESSTPEADGRKIAESIGGQVMKQLEGMVNSLLVKQSRPGGLLNAGIGG